MVVGKEDFIFAILVKVAGGDLGSGVIGEGFEVGVTPLDFALVIEEEHEAGFEGDDELFLVVIEGVEGEELGGGGGLLALPALFVGRGEERDGGGVTAGRSVEDFGPELFTLVIEEGDVVTGGESDVGGLERAIEVDGGELEDGFRGDKFPETLAISLEEEEGIVFDEEEEVIGAIAGDILGDQVL